MIFASEPIIINYNDTTNSFVQPMGQLVFQLTVNETGSNVGQTYIFKTDADPGPKSIDVASAFRAEFIRQGELTPENRGYTSLGGKCTVSLEWLADGVVHSRPVTADGTQLTYPFANVLRGGKSDLQRFMGIGTPANSLSLKPQSVEVVGTNSPYFWPGTQSSEAPVVGANVGAKTFAGTSRTIYVEDNPQRTTFAFINSFGLIESACAVMLESKSYKIERETYGQVGTPTYIPSRKFVTRTHGRRAVWKMSSGFCEREWMEWWTTDFLCSDRHWMWTDGHWLPVIIEPGDEVEIYDKAKGELHSVNFTVKSAY